ncbi:MAG: chorismate mutase [Candidatus Sumerlaeota bacterium]
MSGYLDLQGRLRPGLDILAHEIIIALKKRTRYPRNLEIYNPGLVRHHPNTSLLEFELHRMEELHAELGRYTYAAQEPFSHLDDDIECIIERKAPEEPTRNYDLGMGPKIIEFYLEWMQEACESGSDSNTFGETVTADVTALIYIGERVNMGKSVAEFKYYQDPEKFHATHGDPDQLAALIVNREREEDVLSLAWELGEHYYCNPDRIRAFFRKMIDTTVELEVLYLQKRIAEIEKR